MADQPKNDEAVFTTGYGDGQTGVAWTDGNTSWMWVEKPGGVDRTYATAALVDFTPVDVRVTFYDVMDSTKIDTPGFVHRLEKSVQVVMPLSAVRTFAADLADLVNRHQARLRAAEEFAKLESEESKTEQLKPPEHFKGVQ
jgi:hypothetical protein